MQIKLFCSAVTANNKRVLRYAAHFAVRDFIKWRQFVNSRHIDHMRDNVNERPLLGSQSGRHMTILQILRYRRIAVPVRLNFKHGMHQSGATLKHVLVNRAEFNNVHCIQFVILYKLLHVEKIGVSKHAVVAEPTGTFFKYRRAVARAGCVIHEVTRVSKQRLVIVRVVVHCNSRSPVAQLHIVKSDPPLAALFRGPYVRHRQPGFRF